MSSAGRRPAGRTGPGRIVRTHHGHERAAHLLPDRRHLRLHRLPGRRRARPRAGHPGRPDRRGRHRAAAELPAGQARGRRGLHVHDHRPDRRLDAARHDRALLFRLPPAPPRRPPGDLVRVQRLRPDPGPQPQVRGPSRLGDPADGRRPQGAPRLGRDRRPPAAQERGRRVARHPGLRALQPGLHRRQRHRSGRARDAPDHARRTTGSATCRAGSTTSSGAGRRRKIASGSSSTRTTRVLVIDGRDRRAAAGRLGVPHHARASAGPGRSG